MRRVFETRSSFLRFVGLALSKSNPASEDLLVRAHPRAAAISSPTTVPVSAADSGCGHRRMKDDGTNQSGGTNRRARSGTSADLSCASKTEATPIKTVPSSRPTMARPLNTFITELVARTPQTSHLGCATSLASLICWRAPNRENSDVLTISSRGTPSPVVGDIGRVPRSRSRHDERYR